MNKVYKIKIPLAMYIQLIAFTLLALMQLLQVYVFNDRQLFFEVMYKISFLIYISIPLTQLIKLLKKNNILEITSNHIKVNNTEVQYQEIEKIIIQGYFIQSIGIKLHGKRFIKNDLHFRFKYNEEQNIEELKQWAMDNGIAVTNQRIYRWL